MHLRRCSKKAGGKVYEYWKLVESYRTERGPRQRVVAYLGDVPEAVAQGIKAAVQHGNAAPELHQASLFEDPPPQWAEIDLERIRVERGQEFGGPWLGLQVLRKLGLVEFLESTMGDGRAAIEWSKMALVLLLCRLCHPSSELAIAEDYYAKSGLEELLGIPAEKVNDDRLYRALDQLLPHKAGLEQHLQERLGELFDLHYDLLLYDMTSTYFEGQCARNEQARRGYSRDHRGDCKQVTIGLVVTKEGMPLAYEVFGGGRADVTTVEEIVTSVEERYGKANRIWVMDRGMVSQDHVQWLREGGRRYILGTPKSQLRHFERDLVEKENWESVHDGLEVKCCQAPVDDAGVLGAGVAGHGMPETLAQETFILCRSRDRQQKEAAIHDRFAQRIETELAKLEESCRQRKYRPLVMAQRVGRLLGRNTRAEKLFEVEVKEREDGGTDIHWRKIPERADWSRLNEGCYLLRTNITEWSGPELWQAYIQLTQAETAFRINKQDLSLRPVWHQRADRVQAHILVCFLAYVLWKSLGLMCRNAGLGDEPRQVLRELSEIRSVSIVLTTKSGVEIRRRYVVQPNPRQAALLQHLQLKLPKTIEMKDL